MKRLFAVVAVVAVLAALFVYGLWRGEPDRVITSNLTGKSVPAFKLPLHTPFLATFGPELDYQPGSYGKPVIINFWATWCAPCRTEAPLLQTAWQEFGAEVEIIGVQTLDKDRHQAGRDFISEFGLTFPNVIDNSNRVGISYGIFGLPETFFVAADGTLLHKHAGAVTQEVLDEQIRALTR